MKKEQKFESKIFYHGDHGCWTMKNGALGVSGTLLGKPGVVRVLVREGELFNEGDIIAEVNGKPVRAPYYATVDEINKELESRPVTGADWIIRVKDINPKISIYPAPPLEVLGVKEPLISENELYRRIRKNMNMPGVECKNIAEVVDLLCSNRSSKKHDANN